MTPVIANKDDAKTGERARLLTYVLVTPARNEESFIELTLKSVVAQTIKPLKWIIVSDGSTDRTDAIVSQYSARHGWIELVRTPERKERHFAGKVLAFNAGYESLKGLEYDVLGSLDADVSFDEDYFEYLLSQLLQNPELGLVGTPFTEDGRTGYDYRFVSVEHVSGGCQVFRRQCFEDIGGYIPMKGGGVDHVAVIKARMNGWKTCSFLQKSYAHHRKMGTAKYGSLRSKFEVGKLDFALGGHPLWELFRVAYQLTKKPWILGGVMIFFGYFGSYVLRKKRSVPADLIAFRGQEQMERLKKLFFGKLAGPKSVVGSAVT
jgi:biofilm PGA synthesis N-glycosyltransferase PgaC